MSCSEYNIRKLCLKKIYSRDVYKNIEELNVHSLNYKPDKFIDGYLSVSGQFICQIYLQAG